MWRWESDFQKGQARTLAGLGEGVTLQRLGGRGSCGRLLLLSSSSLLPLCWPWFRFLLGLESLKELLAEAGVDCEPLVDVVVVTPLPEKAFVAWVPWAWRW